LKKARVSDPIRLNLVDIYSNILFVNENTAALSFLAHHAAKADKVSCLTL
jgi:hypothetical protein